MSMTTDELDLHECLQLMKNDIGEAIAADELLYVIEHHVNNNWADPPSKLEAGLQYVVDSLAFRMALAINRLFQPARQDRANFAQLQKLAVATGTNFNSALDSAFAAAATLGASGDLTRLKACRDGFMAHTLRGSLGSRYGMQSSVIADALVNAERIFEYVHKLLTGSSAGLSAIRANWRQRATDFWQERLPTHAVVQADDPDTQDQISQATRSEKGERVVLLDETDDFTTFSDWQKFFSRLDPSEVGAVWSEVYEQKHSPYFMLSFHSAVIDRLMEIAHLSVNATDAQRALTLEFADKIIRGVHEQFAKESDALARFDGAIENARKFYEVYGTPTTREFLRDRGFTTGWGAALDDLDAHLAVGRRKS
jgi:hypothetical protein